MSRPRKPDPKYRHHRPSGQAVVTLSDAAGRRRDVYLGPWRSPASRREYARVLNEWQATLARPQVTADLTVNEVVLHFLQHADEFYGRGSTEPREYRRAVQPLCQLYGHTIVTEFGPRALKAVREMMIGAGWCRNTVNARTARLKRLFKWAASEELCVASVFHGLQTLNGLSRGRTAAPESPAITPVVDAHVDAVMPFVLPEVAAMIALQRLTGMRPGEVCGMRATDIDMGGDVWLYRPAAHKTAWRGKSRVGVVRRKVGPDLLPGAPTDRSKTGPRNNGR